jgi:hypothetical protein
MSWLYARVLIVLTVVLVLVLVALFGGLPPDEQTTFGRLDTALDDSQGVNPALGLSLSKGLVRVSGCRLLARRAA